MKLVTLAVVIAMTYCLTLHDDGENKRGNSVARDQIQVRALKVVAVREVDLPCGSRPPVNLAEIHPCGAGLRVLLEVAGPPVQDAIEWGHPRLSTLDDDHGRHLALPEFSEELVRINRETMFFYVENPPANSLWIQLELPLPDRNAKTITISGSQLIVLAKRRQLSLSIAKESTGQLESVDLEAIGVTCAISRQGNDTVLATFEGDVRRVLDAVLVRTGEKTKVYKPRSHSRSFESRADFLFWSSDKIEGALTLQVEIALETDAIDVPFRLPDLPVP